MDDNQVRKRCNFLQRPYFFLLHCTFYFHSVLSVMRDPAAGLCLAVYRAAPAFGGHVPPPLFLAFFLPVIEKRIQVK